MRVNEFKREINQLEQNEAVYINAINVSPAIINELRELIKSGVIAPEYEEVIKVTHSVESVMIGETILPQMYYIKL